MKKKLVALLLCLVMALSLIPTTVWAASNSTVVLHPSVGNTVTGVKVRVGDLIDGHPVTKIGSNFSDGQYDITVDLGTYNVNNDSFRLPYAKDIWYGVDNNKVDYISWAGGGSNRRSEGASALLVNGKNTAYYYFKGSGGGDSYLWNFTLQYDANGGTGAPAAQTYGTNDKYTKSYTFTISMVTPTREGYTFVGWAEATRQPGGSCLVSQTASGYNGGSVTKTLYAVWKANTPPAAPNAPTAEELKDLTSLVKVHCTTVDSGHADKTYGLIDGSFTAATPVKQADGSYTSVVTIKNGADGVDKYVAKYNTDVAAGHVEDTGHDLTITVVWTNGTWGYGSDAADPATINVKCTPAPVEPSAPTAEELKDLTSLVKVHCTTVDSGHADKTYGLIDGSFTAATPVKQADGSYTSVVTIKDGADGVAKYVAAYNTDVAAGHVEGTNHDLTIKLVWKDKQWGASPDGDTATIYVKCTPAPDAPGYDDLKNLTGLVKVHCTTADSGHADKTYGLIDGSFTAATPVKQADGSYTSVVTIKDGADGVAKYVAAYNTDVAAGHVEGTNHDLTIKLVWKDKQWGASPDGDTATIYVKCNPVPSAPSYDELKNIRGVLVDCLSDPQAITHSDMAFPFFENTYEVGDVVLDQGTDQYTCVVTVTDPQAYVNSYDFMLGLMLGKTDLIHHIMQPTTQTPTVTLVYDETNGWQRPERTYAIITAICMPKAPTAKDLEGKELVKVDCDTRISHSEKTYALLDGTFTTAVTVDKEGIFQCVITITQDGAKKYVEQYSKDLNKTHSLKELKDATITLKYEDNSWGVDDNDNSASILAKCSTGSNTTTGTDDGKTVTSQKTFDAGIALYAGLSILSLTGGALVIRKRKEF